MQLRSPKANALNKILERFNEEYPETIRVVLDLLKESPKGEYLGGPLKGTGKEIKDGFERVLYSARSSFEPWMPKSDLEELDVKIKEIFTSCFEISGAFQDCFIIKINLLLSKFKQFSSYVNKEISGLVESHELNFLNQIASKTEKITQTPPSHPAASFLSSSAK